MEMPDNAQGESVNRATRSINNSTAIRTTTTEPQDESMARQDLLSTAAHLAAIPTGLPVPQGSQVVTPPAPGLDHPGIRLHGKAQR
eukprot:4569537-Amphidinium_carterae.3